MTLNLGHICKVVMQMVDVYLNPFQNQIKSLNTALWRHNILLNILNVSLSVSSVGICRIINYKCLYRYVREYG